MLMNKAEQPEIRQKSLLPFSSFTVSVGVLALKIFWKYSS